MDGYSSGRLIEDGHLRTHFKTEKERLSSMLLLTFQLNLIRYGVNLESVQYGFLVRMHTEIKKRIVNGIVVELKQIDVLFEEWIPMTKVFREKSKSYEESLDELHEIDEGRSDFL